MKVWVTGEAGCIAKNLVDYCNVNSNYEVVNRLSETYFDYWRMAITCPQKEINIFDPSLPRLIQDSGADVIVHTANIDYDLTKKNPHLAIHTHIDGAYEIAELSKKLDIPLLTFSPPASNNLFNETQIMGQRLIWCQSPQYATITVPYLYGKYDTKSFIAKMILSAKGESASLPKIITSYQDFIHTSEVIQIIDNVLSNNFFSRFGKTAGASTTRESLQKIYSSIHESHNFMMDCSFEQDDFIPKPMDNAIYSIGIDAIKNRVVMKDAIENMIKDFGL